MIPSTELYDLIKELTPAEKRHFKIMASRHVRGKENLYVNLFNSIDKQGKGKNAAYREELIKNDLDKKDINQFPVVKNYLYNLVLDSLHSLHIDDDDHLSLNKSLVQISLLFRFRLYKQCSKLIEKSLKRATDIEAYEKVAQFYAWKQRLIRATQYIKTDEATLEYVIQQKRDAIEKFQNIEDYEDLADKIFFLMRAAVGLMREDKLKKLKALIEHPLFQDPKKALTTRSSILYYNTLSTYYFHIEPDIEKAFELLNPPRKAFEENKKLLINYPVPYMGIIHNSIALSIVKGDYETGMKMLNTFRSIPSKYSIKTVQHLNTTVFFQSYSLETGLYLESKDFRRILDIIDPIEDGLKKFLDGGYKSKEDNLYFNICYLFFAIGEYRNALKWSNRIVDIDEFQNLEGLTLVVKLLQAIIHYKMKNFDFLDYYLRSLQKFMKKKASPRQTEFLVLNLLRKLVKSKNSEDATKAKSEALEKFKTLQNDPNEMNLLIYFDFLSWIKSELLDLPFEEVVKNPRV